MKNDVFLSNTRIYFYQLSLLILMEFLFPTPGLSQIGQSRPVENCSVHMLRSTFFNYHQSKYGKVPFLQSQGSSSVWEVQTSTLAHPLVPQVIRSLSSIWIKLTGTGKGSKHSVSTHLFYTKDIGFQYFCLKNWQLIGRTFVIAS